MLRMGLAMLLALGGVLLLGTHVIAYLKKLKFGQTIYELGPQTHLNKQGTPAMGGIMIAGMTILAAVVFHPQSWNGINDFSVALCILSLLTMLVGFIDDYTKMVKKRSLGLTARQKIIGQVLVALAFATYCYAHPLVGSKIILPFFGLEWDLGVAYIPLMTLLIIFMVNSANLQDGIDGILSSVSAVGNVAWAVIAVIVTSVATTMPLDALSNYQSLAIFATALTGACLGFLFYNHYPAKVFMGDTGSMFIGGATVGMALLLRQPFLLLLISFTMVMSSLSVIIQRFYFKVTKGKRIFKMSPIHHHFELSGMSEKNIVLMYVKVTALLCLVAILSVIPF